MKPLFPAVLGLVLCLLLTSCVVTSDNPLSASETAQPDPRLVGSWHSKGDRDEVVVFSIKNAHWMHLEYRQKNSPPESYDLSLTVIGHDHFLNCPQTGTDAQGHPAKPGYLIVRYEISAHHVLSMWYMDPDKTAAAVRAGKLKGSVHPTGWTTGQPPQKDVDVTLQDPGTTIAKFIEDSGLDALFGPKGDDLYRIDPSK